VGAKVQALREAQAAGYTVVMIFICVDSAELSALRVESRVQDKMRYYATPYEITWLEAQ
jgi:predicted ABC-type ATPase